MRADSLQQQISLNNTYRAYSSQSATQCEVYVRVFPVYLYTNRHSY